MKKLKFTSIFLILALVSNPFAYSFSDTFDAATPAGSDDPTQGDDRIRELKRAWIERFAVEHIIPAVGSTYDGATVGYHKLVRLPEQGSAPSTPASYGAIYTKDSGTQPELFFREESDGDEVQLTSNGALNVASMPMSVLRNLKVVRDSAIQVTVTADELVLRTSGTGAASISTVSEAISITTSGAGGLVSSLTEASGTWYYIWIARKSTDGTVNGYLSTTADLATFLGETDSGYNQAALVSAVRNDGSSNFVNFRQEGRRYNYLAWQTLASGDVDTGAWVSIDTTAYVPSTLSTFCYGSIVSAADASVTAITNDNTVSTGGTADRNKIMILEGSGFGSRPIVYWQMDIITANALYWISDNSSSKIWIHGFEINKLF